MKEKRILFYVGIGFGSESQRSACKFGGEAMDLNYETIYVHICCISITIYQQRVFIIFNMTTMDQSPSIDSSILHSARKILTRAIMHT